MRPLRLQIEGFTSFAERTELDFSTLDLFAITGPTGAGKSSLIDAMVFALYGWVPRVGKEYRQLISHGAERLAVQLDFQVGPDLFRVSRNVRKSDGKVQARLDRIVDGEAESLASKVSEIESEVERIVGLDHDGFTRSVVLPQGEFDRFLKGKPDERRKILVSLLNLRIYEDMQAIAYRRAAAANQQSEFIAKQLATDYADATPQHLSEQRKARRTVEAEQKQAEADRNHINGALEIARSLRTLRRDLAGLNDDCTSATSRLKQAEADEKTATKLQDEVAKKLTALEKEAKTLGFDDRRLMQLLEFIPKVKSYARELRQVAEFETTVQRTQRGLEKATLALGGLKKEEPLAQQRVAKAVQDLKGARVKLEDLKRRHAALSLRKGLKRGDDCPVCERPLDHLPASHVAGLDAAEVAVESAEATLNDSRQRQTELAAERKGCDADKKRLDKELAEQQGKLSEANKVIASLRRDLAKEGYKDIDRQTSAKLLTTLERECRTLQDAKEANDSLQQRRKSLDKQKADVANDLVVARTRASEAHDQIAELQRRMAKAQKTLDCERDRLLALAEKQNWKKIESLPRDSDEVDVLGELSVEVGTRLKELSSRDAQLQTEIQNLEKKIQRAAELNEERKALNQSAALANELSVSLRANQFIAYIQEEALRVLAEDGSKHLETLSQGRYALVCTTQEFSVVDHWSADEVRSVKTLSGGESFLASLALALALAERLATFSSEGRAQQRLESLFLDEGFGTLDRETLDVVVLGIEALHGGRRMVGVVTHIPELAERMPVRVEVAKRHGQAGLSIT